MKSAGRIIISVVLTLGVRLLASFATQAGVTDWYPTINKPFFNPPNWLFAPVWTTLYILMGIAAGMIWNMGIERFQVRQALTFFVLQLILNGIWSFLFFYFESPGWAFLELLILWLTIFITIKKCGQLSKPAMWMLVPYLAWVSFAGVLNGSIWWLN
jgi:tryptophan-rich sensory protein